MAISQITSNSIAAGAVSASDLADGSVTPAKLSTGAPYWDTSGNVGIGTSSPTGRFSVTAAASQEYGAFDAPTSGYAFLRLRYNGTSYGNIGQGNAVVTGGAATDMGINATTNMLFATNGTTERMRIDSSGNLLSGTTSTSGSISNSTMVVGGRFKTASGSLTQSGGGAWYDAFTLTNAGLYILHAYVGGYNAGPGDWSNAWFISYTGANNPYVATALGATGNVQARTKTGATTTIQIYLGAGSGITYTWVVQCIN